MLPPNIDITIDICPTYDAFAPNFLLKITQNHHRFAGDPMFHDWLTYPLLTYPRPLVSLKKAGYLNPRFVRGVGKVDWP